MDERNTLSPVPEARPASPVREQTAWSHPLRRFFARTLDLYICGLVWAVLQCLVLRWSPASPFASLFVSYITFGLLLLLEPLLLCTWGTTPGKAVMGLVLRHASGRKLTYREALARTLGVFGHGFGYNIPIYSLVRLYKCHQASKHAEAMAWDGDTDYQLTDQKRLRSVALAAALVAVILLDVCVAFQRQLPPNRGALTPAQYAENVNDYLQRNHLQFGKRMSESGQWVDTQDHAFTVFLPGQVAPNHILQIENGVVSGVTFTVESRDRQMLGMDRNYTLQKQLITAAFLGAQKNVGWRTLLFDPAVRAIFEDRETYSRDVAGVHIENQTLYSGYEESYGGYLWPGEDGEEKYFFLYFSMQKASAGTSIGIIGGADGPTAIFITD